MNASSELMQLARQVERLAPSHRDPHAFHERKSDIAHTLRLIAKGITPSKDGKLPPHVPALAVNVQLVRFGR